MDKLGDSPFPAAVYAETVLSVNFRDAQKHFLHALLEIHYAHTLMLARQEIIPLATAQQCITGLDALDHAELSAVRYDVKFEDLFSLWKKLSIGFAARPWRVPCTPRAAGTISRSRSIACGCGRRSSAS